MKSLNIYVDLDGVMADFDQHFKNLFGKWPHRVPDKTLWKCINSVPDFFRTMPTMPGAVDLWRAMERTRALNLVVLTACPKSSYASVATQKRAWVREHLSDTCVILPVSGGVNKCLFMHSPGDVLIDDTQRNLDAWEAMGGVGIFHVSPALTLKALDWATG